MEEFTVLILCAGESARWGAPKQLLDIDGESILERQIRQAKFRSSRHYKHHECDIRVVTHEPQIAQVAKDLDVDTFYPERRGCTCETLLSCRDLWGDTTMILLGDVIFSWYAMTLIFEYEAEMAIFGNESEIYAMLFGRSVHDRVEQILKEQIAHECDAATGKLRQLYERYCDPPRNDPNHPPEYDAEKDVLVWLRDWTTDMDYLIEYENFKTEVIEPRRLNDTLERTA